MPWAAIACDVGRRDRAGHRAGVDVLPAGHAGFAAAAEEERDAAVHVRLAEVHVRDLRRAAQARVRQLERDRVVVR